MKMLGALADRLVGSIVPKTTAGACACNDSFYSPCGTNKCKLCRSNCNCTVTTCSACIYSGANC